MKDSYFTLAMLEKALETISKESNSEDGDVPILISVNEDNPSVIRLAALVQTEDDDEEEFIVFTDDINELDELNSGGTKVITAAYVRNTNDIEK